MSINGLKANPDKFHLMLSESSTEYFVKVANFTTPNSQSKNYCVSQLIVSSRLMCTLVIYVTKQVKKLHAITRISHFMDIKQRQIIMKAFIYSQFGYCSLVWMFHSRKMNNHINKIHETSLRIVFNDYRSTFRELLDKDNSVTIHERNIQNLAIELHKVINGLSPVIMSLVFPIKENIKYCSKNKFKTRNIHTAKYGTETLAHLGPKIWALVPDFIKAEKSLSTFKIKNKELASIQVSL